MKKHPWQPRPPLSREALDTAWRRFMAVDGGQRAAAFAYSAFFALFPMVLLTVSVASYFLSPEEAAQMVVGFIEKLVPPGSGSHPLVFQAISRLAQARGQAGAIALLMLVWTSAQFFSTLVQGVNRAWGTTAGRWWNLPVKSLALLGVTAAAVLTGIGLPVIGRLAAGALHSSALMTAAERFSLFVLPWLAVYVCLAFFYRLAPHRRTSYAEVRFAALCATALLYVSQAVFVIYFRHFTSLNAVYGAFGGLMGLLLWFYVSGCIFIFCACLSAAQAGATERRNG